MQRRKFIGNTALAGLGLSLNHVNLSSFANGASNKIRVAVIGTNGRGLAHIEAYHTIPNVEIAYI